MKTKKDQNKAFWFSLLVHVAVLSVMLFSLRSSPTTFKKTIDLDLSIKKFKEAPPPPEPEKTPEPEKIEEVIKKGPTPKNQTGLAKPSPGPPPPQGPQTQANSSVAVDAPSNSGRAPFMGGDGYGDGGDGDGGAGSAVVTEYLQEHFTYIRDIIFQHMKYPEEAKQKGLEGKVIIAFVIMEDGNVKDIKILTSSGFEMLDKSAVETIKTSAPFPKPPVHAELRLPINYVIETEAG